MTQSPFTALREQTERAKWDAEQSMLRRLHGMLSNQDLETPEEFTDLMMAAFENGLLNYKEIADALGYSRSSVHRWVRGKTTPHPLVWPTITRWIVNAIDERLQHESFVERRRAH